MIARQKIKEGELQNQARELQKGVDEFQKRCREMEAQENAYKIAVSNFKKECQEKQEEFEQKLDE